MHLCTLRRKLFRFNFVEPKITQVHREAALVQWQYSAEQFTTSQFANRATQSQIDAVSHEIRYGARDAEILRAKKSGSVTFATNFGTFQVFPQHNKDSRRCGYDRGGYGWFLVMWEWGRDSGLARRKMYSPTHQVMVVLNAFYFCRCG